ncbi:MAG: sulfotransferase [Cyanobacteriota bacterium]|nr:sulfotransferase [Cyanobacteriota bacterium]
MLLKDRYHKALRIKPDNLKIVRKLAEQYFSGKEFHRACEYYLKAVQLKGILSSDFAEFKNIEAIRSKVVRWNDISELNELWLIGISVIFAEARNQQVTPDDLEKGINSFKQALKAEPEFSFFHNLLGELLTHQGKIQEAIYHYQAFSYQETSVHYPELTKQHWIPQHLRNPDFIIGGFVKCGTTSLYRYLTSHPQVLSATRKEILFFSRFLDKGANWYFSHFPAIQDKNYLTGEASASYFAWANPEKILELLPDIKLICLIRNPVDVLVSIFHQNQRFGFQQFSLEESLSLSIQYLQELLQTGINNFVHKNVDNCSILEQNALVNIRAILYVYFLKKWICFFPKKQFLILKSEEFCSNPSATMKEVYRFLNLPDYQLKDYPKYNSGSYSSISDDLRCQLAESFRPYNQELEELLGRKLNWN